ncbi:cytochrome c3 family protein [Congregibacter sp.]|uniref:cytochrome c3 family protein n=1 Tax=Congregibacter sp. TaxID=2744308 RepID=UPI003F6BE34F
MFTDVLLRALFLMCILATVPVQAAKIERLVMPGPLISGHADTEEQCGACHTRDGAEIQNTGCLDCHEDVAADVTAKQGFHGLKAAASSASCASCHSDHLGRDAQTTGLDKELFVHADTDFPLEGMHLGLACAGCHDDGSPFREAGQDCVSCHEDDDAHQNFLGDSCDDCHSPLGWRETSFDHDETEFSLQGTHEQIACAACHLPGQEYDAPEESCVSCHSSVDVHQGTYGKSCDSCHTPEEWADARFDHAETEFPLQGSHEDLTCRSCHSPASDTEKMSTSCVSCHSSVDIHDARFGDDCESCHKSDEWASASFDHGLKTEFALTGSHGELGCHDCHGVNSRPDTLTMKEGECVSCHRATDAHRGELGEDCAACHTPDGWLSEVSFDHSFTAFPLYGMHVVAPCESCHVDTRFSSAQASCFSCHEAQDEHEGTLGESCQQCHNANDWTLWRFDHDLTDFSLTGSHEDIACDSCHTSAPVEDTPQECGSCHAADDVHAGAFGNQCERCHQTSDFTKVLSPGDRRSGGRR